MKVARYIKVLLVILGGAGSMPNANSQTYTVPQESGQDLMRRQQLMGNIDSNASLTINPIQVPLSLLDSLSPVLNGQHAFTKGNTRLTILPVGWWQQYNSHHPYGWNNAPLIPAKGYQTMFSAGIHAQVGAHLSIQFNPQFVYAGNPSYESAPANFGPRDWNSYYQWVNTSDIPQHFGPGSYTRLFPGQSSIKYNTRNLSFGISTENLWWGPGNYNSLIMSNNAPGFLHATINTIKPIHTGIGSFEGQIIGGKLDDSGITPDQYKVYNGNFIYQPKNDEWRYITGMVLTWQPKWVKHLFLGVSKASYLYHSDIHSPLDVLPLQGFFGTARTKSEKDHQKASMGSLFARYFMPKEQAEIYVEYGRGDKSLMPWAIFQSPQYRRAYVAGFRKLFESRNNAHIQVLLELAQMEAPTADLINNPQSWYTHPYVRQGYTNLGRVIGAGIGPGSNSETLELSWIKGYKKLGLRLERLVHNNDFYYYAFHYIQDYRRHWTDLSATLNGDWDYKQFLFSAKLGFMRTINYQWQVFQTDGGNYFTSGYYVFNLGARVSVAYRF